MPRAASLQYATGMVELRPAVLGELRRILQSDRTVEASQLLEELARSGAAEEELGWIRGTLIDEFGALDLGRATQLTETYAATGAHFSKAEVDRLLQLAALLGSALAEETSNWSASQLYDVARRAMCLRLGTRLPSPGCGALAIELAGGVDAAAVRRSSFGLERLYEGLEALLRDRSRAEKAELVRGHALLPDDLLVDPRLSISGAGLFKSLEFQAIDRMVDDLLDLRVDEVTRQLKGSSPERYAGAETYWHLPPAMLLTSYVDIQAGLRAAALAPGTRVIDLGTAFGRPGMVIGLTRPDLDFIGYEIVAERVAEADRAAKALGLKNVAFVEQDLAAPDFRIPEAGCYFLYDPFSTEGYRKVMADLEQVARGRPIKLIAVEGRWELLPLLRAQPWLEETTSAGMDWKCCIFESVPAASAAGHWTPSTPADAEADAP